MTGQELVKKYPKTTSAIVQWCISEAKKTTSVQQHKFLDTLFNQEVIANMWDSETPRFLFDFFDSVQIYLYVVPKVHSSGKIGPPWFPTVQETYLPEQGTRIEAEKSAYLSGFEKYEKEK